MRRTTRMALGLAVVLAGRPIHSQEVLRDDMLKFSLDVYGEWTDNRDGVSGSRPSGAEADAFAYEKVDSTKYGISPRIHFYRGLRGSHILAEYSPTYTWWENPRVGQSKTEWSHEVFGEYRYNSGGRTDLTLRDSFKYIADPDLYMGKEEAPFDPSANRVTDENSHIDNRADGVLRYRLSQRFYADVDAYSRIKRYDDDLLAQNGDEDEYGTSLYLWYQQTALFSYGVNLAYTSFDRHSVDNLPMGLETYTIGLGTRYKINKFVEASGSYGYEYAYHEDAEIEDREYPTDLNLELAVTPTARTRAVAGVTLSVMHGQDYPYVSEDQKSFYSTLTWTHTSRLSSTYRAEYRILDYEEKYTNPNTPDSAFVGPVADLPAGSRNGSREEVFLRAGLNLRCTDKLTVSVYYSFEDISSDVSDSYTVNTVGARAHYEF